MNHAAARAYQGAPSDRPFQSELRGVGSRRRGKIGIAARHRRSQQRASRKEQYDDGESAQDLLLNALRDIYDADKQLLNALPKMAKAAASERLRPAFQGSLEATKTQVARLEQGR